MNRLISIFCVFFVVMTLSSCLETSGKSSFDEARRYFELKEFRSSQLIMKQLISEEPNNPEYRSFLAKIYFNVGDYTNALIEWRKGDELGSNGIDDASLRIYAYLQTGAFNEIIDLDEELYSGDTWAELKAAKLLSRISLEEPVENPLLEIDSLLEDSSAPSIWIAKALILLNDQRSGEALESVEQALQIDPDNILAKSLKAEIAVVNKQYDQAVMLYSDVVSAQPWRHADLLKRAVIHLRRGDLVLAEKDINYLKKIYPKSVSINYAKGIVEFQKSNLEQSIQSFKVAENDTQLFSGSLLYLASANRSLGNYLQSEDYAQRYFSSNPDDKHGRLMLASIHLEGGNYSEVIELLKEETEKFSDSVEFSKIYASALVLLNPEKGIRYLSEQSKQKKSAELYVMLATALNQSERYQQSNQAVEQGLLIASDNLKLRYLKVANLVSLQDVEAALSEASALVSEFPSEASLSMLSEIYYVSGNFSKWKETLISITEQYPGSERANLELAKKARESGDVQRAEEYYQAILRHDEGNKSARLELFSLWIAKAQWEKAEQQLIDVIELYPEDIQAKSILADFYLNRNESTKAKSIFSSVLDEVYQDPTAYGLYIRAFIEGEEFDDARFHLERYAELMPNSPIPGYLLAKISATVNDSDSVLVGLERSLASNPEFYPSLLAMAKYHASQRDVTSLKLYVDRLSEIAPSLSETKLVTARYHELMGDYDLASKLAEEVYRADLSHFAMTYWALNCYKAKSLECLKAADNAYSSDGDRKQTVLQHFGVYYIYLGEESRAINIYEKVLTLSPDNVEALNNLGWLYSSIDPGRSLEYATKAFKLAPDSSQVLDTYGMSLMAVGTADKALKAINKAIEIEPKNNTFHYHKAYIANKSGSTREALEILKVLMSNEVEFPEKPQAKRLYAQLEKSVYE